MSGPSSSFSGGGRMWQLLLIEESTGSQRPFALKAVEAGYQVALARMGLWAPADWADSFCALPQHVPLANLFWGRGLLKLELR